MRKKWPLTLVLASRRRKVEEEHSDKAVATSESSEAPDVVQLFPTQETFREQGITGLR